MKQQQNYQLDHNYPLSNCNLNQPTFKRPPSSQLNCNYTQNSQQHSYNPSILNPNSQVLYDSTNISNIKQKQEFISNLNSTKSQKQGDVYQQLNQDQSSLELTLNNQQNFNSLDQRRDVEVLRNSENFLNIQENQSLLMNNQENQGSQKIYQEMHSNQSDIVDLSLLSVNNSNIEWINALNQSQANNYKSSVLSIYSQNHVTNDNKNRTYQSQHVQQKDSQKKQVNQYENKRVIGALYQKSQNKYDSLDTNENTSAHNSLENTGRCHTNQTLSTQQSYGIEKSSNMKKTQINNYKNSLTNNSSSATIRVQNYREEIDDALHSLSLERQRQSVDIDKIKQDIQMIRQSNQQPKSELYEQQFNGKSFNLQNVNNSKKVPIIVLNTQTISSTDFESINHHDQANFNTLNEPFSTTSLQNFENKFIVQSLQPQPQTITQPQQLSLFNYHQEELQQLRSQMQKQLRNLETEKEAYIKEKQHFQELYRNKSQETFIEEYSSVKQELFEVKVRLEFLEKEKVKMGMEVEEKDRCLKVYQEENLVLKQRLEKLEQKDLQVQETTAKYIEQQIHVSSHLSKMLRHYFLDYETHEQNTPLQEKLSLLEEHIKRLIIKPQSQKLILNQNQTSSTHLIPRYSNYSNAQSSAKFSTKYHQDCIQPNDENDLNSSNARSLSKHRSKTPTQIRNQAYGKESQYLTEKMKQEGGTSNFEFNTLMRKIDDLEHAIIDKKTKIAKKSAKKLKSSIKQSKRRRQDTAEKDSSRKENYSQIKMR
eukprot:403344378